MKSKLKITPAAFSKILEDSVYELVIHFTNQLFILSGGLEFGTLQFQVQRTGIHRGLQAKNK